MPSNQEQLTMEEKDFQKRIEMERLATGGDEAAQRWMELDASAKERESQVDSLKRDYQGRNEKVGEVETALQEARMEHYDWLEENERPGVFNPSGRKEWDKENQAHENTISGLQENLMTAAERASPDELKSLQDSITEQQRQLLATVEERQGIAKLPSEQAREQEGEKQGQGKEQHEVSDERLQRALSQPSPGGFGAYAETNEDRQEAKELTEIQNDFERQHGRRGTSDEIAKIEQQRASERQASSGDGQRGDQGESVLMERRRQRGQGM